MKQGAWFAMTGILGALAGAGGAILLAGSSAGSASTQVNTTDRAAIEKIVREYILAHPEIIPEAMQNLERRENSERLRQQGARLSVPFTGAWEGAASPDITIVEFFDYACSYCRLARADVARLLADDPKLRVVYRELPILGDPSVNAAKISLAVARMGGNYSKFHNALMRVGRPTEAAITAALAEAGVDPRAARDMANAPEILREIETNLSYQQGLSIGGTPAWIIGDQVIAGAIGYDELKAAVARARSARGK
jgi:protein-disulfide isomerase